MAKQIRLEHTFQLSCKGRDPIGHEVLKKPVEVKVKVYQTPDSNQIKSLVYDCPYNTGGHGERCKASHPGTDSTGRNIRCPYSFIIPDSLDHI